MENYKYKRASDVDGGEEVFSEVVLAGKRKYFFDVKATRGNDYYITLTESRKRVNQDGSFTIEKHKIFLYKEDFEKFSNSLSKVIDFIKNSKEENSDLLEVTNTVGLSSDLEFENL